MIAEMIVPSDPKWTALIARVPHDYYHTPEYLSFSARHEEGEPLAFYAEDESGILLIPFLVRELAGKFAVSEQWRDLTSPYGYASPLFLQKTPSASACRYLRTFIDLAYEFNFVSAFLRFHPLLPLPLTELPQQCQLVRHGQTVTIDVTLDDEQAWRNMRENHRKGIRKLLKNGYTVEMDNVAYWDSFEKVYRETMKRVNASDFYYFSEAYFDGLRQKLGRCVHLCIVLSPEQRLAAAGLFFTTGGIVEFHLSGTAQEYHRLAPSKLMFDHVRRWARDTGYTSLHIGGGVGAESDSLFNFKLGFSDCVNDFYTLRVVLNHRRYDELSLTAGCSEASATVPTGYFPAYREPTIQLPRDFPVSRSVQSMTGLEGKT